MTTRRQVVADELLGKLGNRYAELRERVRFGPLSYEDAMAGLQAILENRFSENVERTRPPIAAGYNKIRNLIYVGPERVEKVMAGNRRNPNPLGLSSDWCPKVVPQYSVEQMKELARFCQVEKDWQTRVIYYLVLQKIGGLPVNLENQYDWLGVKHDNFGPGQVRDNVMYSNWFKGKNLPEALEMPEIDVEAALCIGYEFPRWAAGLNYEDQKKAARDRGMRQVSAVQDTWMLNIVHASTAKRLRETTWSRTSSLYDGYPLDVSSGGYGVYVRRRWISPHANALVGLSVQGVPSELGF